MFSISLAQWSLHRAVFAGNLHPMDFPRFARDTFNITAVEYVNRCFKDHYDDNDRSYVPELKQRCDDLGVQSLILMIDRQGDLAEPEHAQRATAVSNHRPWLESAQQLGCHSIRVNAGGPDVTARAGDPQQLADCAVDGLQKLSEHADDLGLNVLVENHGGVSSSGTWLADVLRRVDHPRCGSLPDFGNFCTDWTRRDDPDLWHDRYDGVAALMPFARAVSAKSGAFDAQGNDVQTDYLRMLRIVRDAGYRGFIGIEYEGPSDDEVAGIKATQDLITRVMATIAGE